MGYSPGREGSGQPQSTQKGEHGIDHPERGAGVQPNIRSVFQKKERILLHLSHTTALRKLSQLCTWGLKFWACIIDAGSGHKGPLRVRGISRGGGWTIPPPQPSSPTASFISLLWALLAYLLILVDRNIGQVSIHPIWNSDNNVFFFFFPKCLLEPHKWLLKIWSCRYSFGWFQEFLLSGFPCLSLQIFHIVYLCLAST